MSLVRYDVDNLLHNINSQLMKKIQRLRRWNVLSKYFLSMDHSKFDLV